MVYRTNVFLKLLGFHPCDTVQNRVDLKCYNSTRVACCEFICNGLHLPGTVLSLETVANIVILIQWCGEPGFDSDVLERGRYVLICSMISCPGETVRPSQKKKKKKKGTMACPEVSACAWRVTLF